MTFPYYEISILEHFFKTRGRSAHTDMKGYPQYIFTHLKYEFKNKI